MRFASLIAVATLSSVSSAAGQAPSPPFVVAARRAIDSQLSESSLRRRHCVSSSFANCPNGGLQVVSGYELGPPVQSGDTVRFAVRFDAIGAVASSEASLMFILWNREADSEGDSKADSGVVIAVLRGSRWDARLVRQKDEPVRTSVAAARHFFEFEADERQRLDSAVARHRRP